jgi:hypothetical protein
MSIFALRVKIGVHPLSVAARAHLRSRLAHSPWQVRYVRRDPPRLVAGEQLGR